MVSREKVEKVVNPPKTPVISNKGNTEAVVALCLK